VNEPLLEAAEEPRVKLSGSLHPGVLRHPAAPNPGEMLDCVRATLFHFAAELLAADVAVLQEREPEVAVSHLSLEPFGNAHRCPPRCRDRCSRTQRTPRNAGLS
jgi:hypothetical protein